MWPSEGSHPVQTLGQLSGHGKICDHLGTWMVQSRSLGSKLKYSQAEQLVIHVQLIIFLPSSGPATLPSAQAHNLRVQVHS